MAWQDNLTLSLDYYFINISEPILEKNGDFLTCKSNITTDFSGADLSTNFSIYMDGIIQQSLSGQKQCINSTECSFSAEPGEIQGHNWTCQVFSGDWDLNSTGNYFGSPAEISAQPFQTDNSTSSHSFTARARAIDPDGTNGITACFASNQNLCGPTYLEPTGNENEVECSSTCASQNETAISVAFSFLDASSGINITTQNSTFAVPNSLPLLQEFSGIALLTPNSTKPYAEFSCLAEFSDPDGDELQIFSRFYSLVSGGEPTLLKESTNATFHCREDYRCNKTAEISCTSFSVDPFGANYSADSLASIQIENSPPGKPEFETANGSVFNSSFAEIEFISGNPDPDGDTVSFVIEVQDGANMSAIFSPANLTGLKKGNFTIRIFATDSEDFSEPDEMTVEVFFNTPPQKPQINRDTNGTLHFNSSDSDGDTITYFLFGHLAGSDPGLVYSGSLTSFVWLPSAPGSYFAFVVATDGLSNSTSDTLNFSVSLPPTTTTTTTAPASGGSGGGGAGGLPPAGFNPAQKSPAIFPQEGNISITVNNSGNQTVIAESGNFSILCMPKQIGPGEIVNISCTFSGTGELPTAISFRYSNGTLIREIVAVARGSGNPLEAISANARETIGILFKYWMNCSDERALELSKEIQKELDLELSGEKSDLAFAIKKAAEFPPEERCFSGKTESNFSSQKPQESSRSDERLNNPYFLASTSEESFFARIIRAIGNFFAGLVSGILRFFGIVK